MVFPTEGKFQQFPHCKFRENVVRLLYIPSIYSIRPNHINNGDDSGGEGDNEGNEDVVDSSFKPEIGEDLPTHFFLSINKFGKVGLYDPERFKLVHTYCLDLTVPMHSHERAIKTYKSNPSPPKCERTHLVIDAAFAADTFCIIFATTKNLLQWYDLGEIQRQNIGLELFPRKEFMGICETSFPLLRVPNHGHLESHRLFGFPFMPTCLEYFCSEDYGETRKHGKLFIGDVDGGITIISIRNPRYPLGRRKIRGKLHKITLSHLLSAGVVQYYKAHHQPITDIYFLSDRDLVLSCSKDKKFSVFVKDMKENVDSIIVSITKGVNTIAYSKELKMIATGSDDHIVRLFSQFVMKMPQMELLGHRSAVLTVEFAEVNTEVAAGGTTSMESEDRPVLLFSYSADSELRAWDPLSFICLQSLYLNFPIGSTIVCKTPEFARKSLIIHSFQSDNISFKKRNREKEKKSKALPDPQKSLDSGVIILLYCNSYARVPLEKERPSKWPFDYDQFLQEYEELSMEYDRILKEKLKSPTSTSLVRAKEQETLRHQVMTIPEEESKEENTTSEDVNNFPGQEKEQMKDKNLSIPEEKSEVDAKLDMYVREIMELRQTIKENSEKMSATLKRSNTGLKRPSMISLKAKSRTNALKPPTKSPSTTSTNAISSESTTLPMIKQNGEVMKEKRQGLFKPTETGNELEDEFDNIFNISVEATNKVYDFKKSKELNLPKQLERMIAYGQVFNNYPVELQLEPVEFTRRDLVVPEEMRDVLGIGAMNSVQDLLTPQARSYFDIDLQKSGSRFFPAKSPLLNVDQEIQQHKRERSVRRQSLFDDDNPFAVIGHKMRNAYEDDEEEFFENDIFKTSNRRDKRNSRKVLPDKNANKIGLNQNMYRLGKLLMTVAEDEDDQGEGEQGDDTEYNYD